MLSKPFMGGIKGREPEARKIFFPFRRQRQPVELARLAAAALGFLSCWHSSLLWAGPTVGYCPIATHPPLAPLFRALTAL
jgi:hypothetical protein